MKILWDEPGFPPFFEDSPDLKECRRSPLWILEPGDDHLEEDVFAPIEVTDPLLLGKDEDLPLCLFIFCEIRLEDGTQLEGVVYRGQLYDPIVRQRVYDLEVFYQDEKISLPRKGIREIAKERSPQEFAHRIGKRLDKITPLTWTTPYRVGILNDHFPSGVPVEYKLSGQIDLLTW